MFESFLPMAGYWAIERAPMKATLSYESSNSLECVLNFSFFTLLFLPLKITTSVLSVQEIRTINKIILTQYHFA